MIPADEDGLALTHLIWFKIDKPWKILPECHINY